MRRLDIFSPFPPSPPPPPLPFLKTGPVIPIETKHNGGGSSSNNLNPSLLIICGILTLVLLVSISLHFVLRYFCRRSSTVTDDVESVEPLPVRRVTSSRVSPEDQSLIDSLPLFSFNAVTGLRRSSAADCAVCLSKFEPHDQLRLLPLCCHAFHSRCIDPWLASSHTCPLCRSSIHVPESDGSLKFSTTSSAGVESFRLEIGSVSNRGTASDSAADVRRSYSMGSFEYVVESESEVVVAPLPMHMRGISVSDCNSGGNDKEAESQGNVTAPVPVPVPVPAIPGSELAADVATGSGRWWLKEYVDRLASSASSSFSSRALSFRISGIGCSGSSRRSDAAGGVASGSGSWDLEGNRYGEEISSFFRWLSAI